MIRFGAFLVVTVLSTLSFASNNPLMRVCRVSGGEFIGISIEQDEIPFCRYGQAMMGSEALLRAQDAELSLAYQSYALQAAVGAPTCELAGAIGHEANGQTLCEFRDGTWIELKTLSRGRRAPENESLENALNVLNL
jgi:hypothetical protein